MKTRKSEITFFIIMTNLVMFAKIRKKKNVLISMRTVHKIIVS